MVLLTFCTAAIIGSIGLVVFGVIALFVEIGLLSIPIIIGLSVLLGAGYVVTRYIDRPKKY